MNKEQEEIFGKISAILQRVVKMPADQITENMRLMEDLGADSVELWDIALSIEKTFSIKFIKKDVVGLSTVSDLIRFIERKQPVSRRKR